MTIDISKFVTVGNDGKPIIDTEGYEKAYDAELCKSLNVNTENTRKKLEAEVRKSLEEEAKLSAEEKLKKDRESFEAEMAKKLKDFAQYQAKSKMSAAGLDEEEISTYLELVTDDASIAKIDKILEMRTKMADSLKKKFEEELVSSQPTPKNTSADEPTNSLGKQAAMKYQNKAQTGETKVTAWGE